MVNDLGGDIDGTGSGTSMADGVVKEIQDAGGEAMAVYGSVADSQACEDAIKKTLDTWGKIDIVINNAGILRDKSMHKMEEKDWSLVIDVHLNGSYFMTHAAWAHMRDAGYGRVVFTTSSAGLWGNFGQANYSAAKLGIVGLMNTLKIEGGPKGGAGQYHRPLRRHPAARHRHAARHARGLEARVRIPRGRLSRERRVHHHRRHLRLRRRPRGLRQDDRVQGSQHSPGRGLHRVDPGEPRRHLRHGGCGQLPRRRQRGRAARCSRP